METRSRTVAAGSRPTGTGSGFFLALAAIIALVVVAAVGLNFTWGHRGDVATGAIEPGATSAHPPQYRPAKVPAAPGDVDGDGQPDAVRILPGPRASGGGRYDDILRVDGTRIGEKQMALDTGGLGTVGYGLAAKQPLDVNGDGFADILVSTSTRGVAAKEEIVTLTDAGLGYVRVGGRILNLSFGSAAGVSAAWGCVGSGSHRGRPGQIEQDVLSPSGKRWTLAVTRYAVTGAVARQESHATTDVSERAGKAQLAQLTACGASG